MADEPQHLDYILSVKDKVGWRRIPPIWEPLRADVSEAVWRSKRWEAYRQATPLSRQEWMAGGGTSYEGYQPPLYYFAMVPVTYMAGGDPLRAMYAVRIAGAALVAVMAALAWLLAVEWFGTERRSAPILAALTLAATPVVAATARVTNDGLIAVLVGLGVYIAARVLRTPTLQASLWFGSTVAAAVLTKSPGVLLFPVALVVLIQLWRRGDLSGRIAVALLGPGIVTWLAWAALTYLRYGVIDGTSAFLIRRGASFPPVSLGEFLSRLWEHSWLSLEIAGTPGFRGMRLAGTTLVTGMIGVGLFASCRPPRPTMALWFSVVVSLGIVAIARLGNMVGLVPPLGRILPPAYLAVAALTAGGLVRVLGPRGASILVVLLCAAALLIEAFWLWPYYHARP